MLNSYYLSPMKNTGPEFLIWSPYIKFFLTAWYTCFVATPDQIVNANIHRFLLHTCKRVWLQDPDPHPPGVLCNIQYMHHITSRKSEKFWIPFHLVPRVLDKGLWTIYLWILKDFLYPFNTLCLVKLRKNDEEDMVSCREESTAEGVRDRVASY